MSINFVWYVVALGAVVSLLNHPDRLLIRHQLSDVAHGLVYLHQYGLVHGNLTGVSLDFLAQR